MQQDKHNKPGSIGDSLIRGRRCQLAITNERRAASRAELSSGLGLGLAARADDGGDHQQVSFWDGDAIALIYFLVAGRLSILS